KPRRTAIARLAEVNTHVDIMDWQQRHFLGTEACLDLTIRHLAAKRTSAADAAEPTGLLTHHLAHDEDAWRFTEQFLPATPAPPAGRGRTPRAIFGVPSSTPGGAT